MKLNFFCCNTSAQNYYIEAKYDSNISSSNVRINKNGDALINTISTFLEGKQFSHLKFTLVHQEDSPTALRHTSLDIFKAFKKNANAFQFSETFRLSNQVDNLETIQPLLEIITLGHYFSQIEIISSVCFTKSLFSSFLSYSSKINLPQLKTMNLQLNIDPSLNEIKTHVHESNLQTLQLRANDISVLENSILCFQKISDLRIIFDQKNFLNQIDLKCLQSLPYLKKLEFQYNKYDIQNELNLSIGLSNLKSLTSLTISGQLNIQNESSEVNLPFLEQLFLRIINPTSYFKSISKGLLNLKKLVLISQSLLFSYFLKPQISSNVEYYSFPRLEELERTFVSGNQREEINQELKSMSQISTSLKTLKINFSGNELTDETVQNLIFLSVNNYSTQNAVFILDSFKPNFAQEALYSNALLDCKNLHQFIINENRFINEKYKNPFTIKSPLDLLRLTLEDKLSNMTIKVIFDVFYFKPFEELIKGQLRNSLERIERLHLSKSDFVVQKIDRLIAFLRIPITLNDLDLDFKVSISTINSLFENGIIPKRSIFSTQSFDLQNIQQLKNNLHLLKPFIKLSIKLTGQSTLSQEILTVLSEIDNHEIQINFEKNIFNLPFLVALAKSIFALKSRFKVKFLGILPSFDSRVFSQFVNYREDEDYEKEKDQNVISANQYKNLDLNANQNEIVNKTIITLIQQYQDEVDKQIIHSLAFMQLIGGLLPINPKEVLVELFFD